MIWLAVWLHASLHVVVVQQCVTGHAVTSQNAAPGLLLPQGSTVYPVRKVFAGAKYRQHHVETPGTYMVPICIIHIHMYYNIRIYYFLFHYLFYYTYAYILQYTYIYYFLFPP